MPRIARIVIPEAPYHITQRGNNRQDIFFRDTDRAHYLALLEEQAKEYGLEVLGYCLMTNHVHLIALPHAADSLAKAVGRTHFLYSQHINWQERRSGHLWQGRFYSCVMDEAHCWSALCYIDRNPVRAGLVKRAWEYPWSSAAAHCGKADKSELIAMQRWQKTWEAKAWRQWLRRPEDEEDLNRIRAHTQTGRPLGSNNFLSRLENRLKRRLRPLPVGRPKKRMERK